MGESVTAFSSTRQGGYSEGRYGEFNINRYCGDNENNIRQNKTLLCDLLGIRDEHLIMPHQVHETEVVMVDDNFLQQSADGTFPDDAYLLVDRVKVAPEGLDDDLKTRLLSSINTCFSMGKGLLWVADDANAKERFSTAFELDGITFKVPDEYMFSFNSPLGACPACGGLGKIIGVSEDLVVPDKSKTIYDGAIMGWFKDHLVKLASKYDIPIFTPYCQLTAKQKDTLWNAHSVEGDENSLVGIREFFDWVESNRYKIQYKFMLNRFSGRTVCPDCGGTRRQDYQRVAGYERVPTARFFCDPSTV